MPRNRLVRPRTTSFFPTRSFYFLLALGKQAGESRRRNASVEKQKRENGRARKRTTRHANGVSISSQSMDGEKSRAEQEKHVQIKRIELRRISQASDAVCSIRKRALPCLAALLLLRCCSLLLAFACFCAPLLASQAPSVLGRRLAESTDPSVWPPAQPKFKSKRAPPWRCATAG